MKTKRSRTHRTSSVDPDLCISTFVDAADAAGGRDQLAKAIRVPVRLLSDWMEGLEVAPHLFYLRALDYLRPIRDAIRSRA